MYHLACVLQYSGNKSSKKFAIFQKTYNIFGINSKNLNAKCKNTGGVAAMSLRFFVPEDSYSSPKIW
jgi:hypothetical protein